MVGLPYSSFSFGSQGAPGIGHRAPHHFRAYTVSPPEKREQGAKPRAISGTRFQSSAGMPAAAPPLAGCAGWPIRPTSSRPRAPGATAQRRSLIGSFYAAFRALRAAIVRRIMALAIPPQCAIAANSLGVIPNSQIISAVSISRASLEREAFRFAQRARTARRACSERCLRVMLSARARPPREANSITSTVTPPFGPCAPPSRAVPHRLLYRPSAPHHNVLEPSWPTCAIWRARPPRDSFLSAWLDTN